MQNNSKTHNNASIEEILSLCFLDSRLLENYFFGWEQNPI